MTNRTVETSRRFYSKLAGFTILFYIAIGLTFEALSSQATSAEGTAAILMRIAEHESEMRVTILLKLLESFSAVVLAVSLYGITRDESHELAMLALVCRVCEGVLGALGIQRTLGLLWLATKGAGAGSPDAATLKTLGDFLLMPARGAVISAPFFAVGSMIFAYLLLRGRIVPVPLAGFGVFASVLLVVGVPMQLAGFFSGPLTWYMWLPMLAFLIPLGLWLLIKGAAAPTRRQPA